MDPQSEWGFQWEFQNFKWESRWGFQCLRKEFQDFSEIYRWSRSGRLNENFSVFVGISKGILLLDRISKRGFQCFGWNVRISVILNPNLEKKNKEGFQLFF